MGPPSRNPELSPEREHLKQGTHGAVASDNEICSKLGGKILKDLNGNAADATITVALCIGLLNSFSSGIGGGTFILSSLYENGNNNLLSIDAREQAPKLAHKDMFDSSKQSSKMPSYDSYLEDLIELSPSKFGGLAVGVPGELKGLYHLFKTHGSGNVNWSDLLDPIIELAENGWEASALLEVMAHTAPNVFKRNYKDWSFLVKNYEEVEKCELNGKTEKCLDKVELIKEGDIIRRPQFAKTLRLIANNGSDAIFYDPNGPIVKSLVKIIGKYNGIVTGEDFAKYRLKTGKPRSTTILNDYEVMVPHTGTSSGIAMLTGLKIMNEFFLRNGNKDFAIGGDLTDIPSQRLVETLKWMASSRTKLGDAVVNNHEEILKQESRIKTLLGDDWVKSAFNNISDYKTLESWKDYRPEFQPVEDNGTSHLSIVDKFNNSVSMTTSVNLLFGSLLIDPNTGIVLNDQMDDFSIPSDTNNAFDLVPSIYNYIEGFKRPLSSMVPVIVIDKTTNLPDLVIGAAGGSRIFTSVLQGLIRKYFYQMPLLETIAYPRVHHQLLPNILYMENHTGNAFKEQMISKGHKIEITESKSVMNGIAKAEIGWEAVSDWWRKHAVAYAY